MDRFGYSSLTSEEINITLSIEKFSLYVCKGYFKSPEFENESSDTKWRLIVNARDGADYDNCIDIRLERSEYVTKDQLVKAKLSIGGDSALLSLKREKDIYFRENTEAQEVLSVTKENLNSVLGLKKNLLLPGDTLTVHCQLVVYKEVKTTFDRFGGWGNNPETLRAVAADRKEYFVNSSMESEKFRFAERFSNFSTYSGMGSCVGQEHQSRNSRWCVVVYRCLDGFDVKVRRNSSDHTDQLTEVKLSVSGLFSSSLCAKKPVYFRGDSDEEVLITTISDEYLSGCFGWNKRVLVPGDALTLDCEIVTFDETANTLVRKEHFERSITDLGTETETETSFWSTKINFVKTGVIYFLYAVLTAISAACSFVRHIALPFAMEYVLPTVGVIMRFVYELLRFCGWWVFIQIKNWLKSKYRNLWNPQRRQNRMPYRNNYQRNYQSSNSRAIQSFVPSANRHQRYINNRGSTRHEIVHSVNEYRPRYRRNVNNQATRVIVLENREARIHSENLFVGRVICLLLCILFLLRGEPHGQSFETYY